jgi:hypothetical protein
MCESPQREKGVDTLLALEEECPIVDRLRALVGGEIVGKPGCDERQKHRSAEMIVGFVRYLRSGRQLYSERYVLLAATHRTL